MLRRATAALAATLAIPACASVLGVSDDPTNAVGALCQCSDVSVMVNLQPGSTGCESTLEGRLEMAPSDVRASWLQAFGTTDCEVCKNALKCYGIAPICIAAKDACNVAGDCCSGTCEGVLGYRVCK